MVHSLDDEGSLVDDLTKKMASGEGADLTLVVGSAQLHVHSFMLSARSPVFAAMLRHDTSGPSGRLLEIGDMDEDVACQMLYFMYTDKVPYLHSLAPQLLAASDKYGLPLLKRKCEQQLVTSLTVENAASAVVLALRYKCPQLKERAIQLIRAHPLDVMATEGWQRDLCTHPEMATEVSRLIAAPSSNQLYSEISALEAATSRQTSVSRPHPGNGWPPEAAAAAPTPPPRRSSLPGSAARSSLVGSLSEEELSGRLLEAAQKGAVEELQALLAAGVDTGLTDEWRNTALHFAACNGHLEAVKCLLDNGADTDARDRNQDTPLHWAAGKGHAAVVQLLVDASADPNVRGKYGMTPLHWAALCGHADTAARLLEAGADLGAQDDCGSTPLDLIRRANHLDMVEFLS
ncbi:poly [ADP-ribose] polymerase tankyrase-1-like [Schistocerca gregaria]|uniref:poly [ADP-ribose] polymerase tankyrase-1-like n=1 Tax=Schistocerca gregaria TaxID=7010 RepID=UPI00211E8DB4|nr:poly [ADP-ribose] polymerase tankyrase-1-like [Schistocerca gregaria]